MRTYILISLLSVITATCGRPQEQPQPSTIAALRKATLPVQTHFRYNSKSLRFPIYEPINSTSNTQYTTNARKINTNSTKSIKNDINWVTKNKDSDRKPLYPYKQVINNNYYSYIIPHKEAVYRPYFSQETKSPLTDHRNNWFQIKLKQPIKASTKTYEKVSTTTYSDIGVHDYSASSYPSVPIYESDVPSNLPPTYSNGLNTNKVIVGNTVTLSPEVVSISQGTHTLAGPETDPCAIQITNNLYNKQACPEVDITINNHIHSESNIYDDLDDYDATELPLDDEYDEDLEQEAVEEEEPIPEDIPEDVPSEDIAGEVASNPVAPAEDAVQPVAAEDPVSGATSGGSGNRPGLPNLPELNRPGSSEEEEDEDDGGVFDSNGIFSWIYSLNPFNFPLVGLLAAPLTILFTGALGISTFFLPWTVLPTLFLGRKAKQSKNFIQSRPNAYHPDGWFWHTRYKTWVNMNTERSRSDEEGWGDYIIKLIEEYGRKFYTNYNESWKRRKKYD